jgi:hypothetical protein
MAPLAAGLHMLHRAAGGLPGPPVDDAADVSDPRSPQRAATAQDAFEALGVDKASAY